LGSNPKYINMKELMETILKLKIEEYQKIIDLINKQILCCKEGDKYYLQELIFNKSNHEKKLLEFKNELSNLK